LHSPLGKKLKITFMNGKKILFVSSELVPYLPENEVSLMSYETPKMVNSNGGQIRIFMPKYGNINERRHQLHEVIRLSGMNLVINDMDMPLIIKVASIPKERIQVYFIDNDEYFKRKATFTDKEGNLFPDNDQRAIFFAKGVMETVKKLNWSPDIIHVHGWMASLLPLYLKKYYADEPLFADSKIVLSVYGKTFEGELDKDMVKKITFDGIPEDEITALGSPTYNNLLKVAVDFSDAVILASENIPEELNAHIANLQKPVLPYVPVQEFEEAYANFYNTEVLK
jgi:starch synthase